MLYSGTSDPNITNTFFHNLRGELVESDDAAGRANLYTYDGMGRVESHEVYDELNNRVSAESAYYNENGELTWSDGSQSDPEDYVWRDYDGAGRKVQEVHWRSQADPNAAGAVAPSGDALYSISFFEYDPFGNLIKAIDPRGNYQRMKYDAVGQLIEQRSYAAQTGLALATNRFAYEPGGQVAFATNALGGVTAKRYTYTGKPEFQSTPDGATNAWTYYLDGRLRREFQRNGAFLETTYDDANRTATRIFYSSTGSPLATNASVFDRRGNVIQSVDAASNVFTNIYDGLDRLKISAGPAIMTVIGNTNIPGPGGGLTTNLVQQVVTNFYDAAGIALTNVNAFGEKSVTTRDALGRVVNAAIYASNSVSPVRFSRFVYSADQHFITQWEGTNSQAIPTLYALDNEGRTITTSHYPHYPTTDLVEFTTQDYDAAGNLTQSKQCTRSNSVVTVWSTNAWTYDALNRVSTETTRDGAVTSYGYDALGNLTNRAMPGNLGWSATYNNSSQILTENDSSGAQSTRHLTYSYYPIGNAFAGLPQTVTDDRGVTRTNLYDDYLRVGRAVLTGPLNEQQLTCNWQYDVRGLVTNLTQSFASTNGGPTTVITRAYNAYAQLTSESTTLNGAALNSVSQGWDSAGRRAQSAGMSFQYRADGLLTGVNGATFGYGDNGLMTGRTNNARSMTMDQRDGTGRPLQATTRVNLSPVLTENWTWTGDGMPGSYTAARSDYTDARSFTYGTANRRLTQETLALGSSQTVTNNYTFDNGQAGGLGVLTGQAAGAASWNGGLDAFARVATETNTVLHRTASGSVNGPATLRGYLNGQSLDLAYDVHGPSAWSADLALPPGTNALTVYADHPSGLFTTNTASTFTVPAGAFDQEVSQYDGAGNVTNRTWKNALGQIIQTQSLSWDGLGQLVRVNQRDVNNNGFNFESYFDGAGRQVRTIETTVTNNVALSSNPAPVTVTYTYDPQVEFLIVGIGISQGMNARQDTLVYGPDVSGTYGGMHGVGGLETVTSLPFNSSAVLLNDAFGNILGAVTNGTVAWNASRVNLYGPVEGYAPPRLSLSAPAYASLAWRTRSITPAGLFQLGTRPYDPVRRAFLSGDPLGHKSDPALNTAFNGNPAVYFDADGRVATRWAGNNFAEAAGLANGATDWGLDAVAFIEMSSSTGVALSLQGDVTPLTSAARDAENAAFSRITQNFTAEQGYHFGAGYFVGDFAPNLIPAGGEAAGGEFAARWMTALMERFPILETDVGATLSRWLGAEAENMTKNAPQEFANWGGEFVNDMPHSSPKQNVVPPQLPEGVDYEAERLAARGVPKNTSVFQPTPEQTQTAAFQIIVGPPKYTPGGQLIGTISDGARNGLLEIKGGSSTLYSTYQMRLQVYNSVVNNIPMTIETSRPVNPTFMNYLQRWGVTVQNPK
ncbi:YD repeat protein [Pedosphaera parvula Ellin514]|uniref:YD repeat protein n=1 Tax=Pedosphaera parvula (strain Ellin514) TaxID=320771 RepID=B9XKD0_PEDPL|nr:YD repeat protein [Pedosphaera parvula Ellin514]